MKISASAAWAPMAATGRPWRLVRASSRKARKSWPMVCMTRGPANIMALTVEISRPAKITPMREAPLPPKACSATM